MNPKLIIHILLLVLYHSNQITAILKSAQFYPTILTSLEQCRLFGKSKAVFARTHAYYIDQAFYINENHSLYSCAHLLTDEFLFKSLIYVVQHGDFANQNTSLVNAINLVQRDLPANMELIVQLKLFLGPGGDERQVVRGLRTEQLCAHFIYGGEEHESVTGQYSQALFASLAHVQRHPKFNMYVLLNGWHLRNMGRPAYLSHWQHIVGFIVYVSRASSHRISTHDATKYLPDTEARLILDMPHSPQFIDTGTELQPVLGLIVLCVGVINHMNLVYLFLSCTAPRIRLCWGDS